MSGLGSCRLDRWRSINISKLVRRCLLSTRHTVVMGSERLWYEALSLLVLNLRVLQNKLCTYGVR